MRRADERIVDVPHQHGEEEIADEDGDKRRDERHGGRASDALGARFRVEPLVARDEPDESAEADALDDPDPDVPGHHEGARVFPVEERVDPEGLRADEPPAEDADGVAEDGEDRGEQQRREEARDDEVADGVGADGGEGVDLLGDAHGPELRGHRASDASGEDHRRQHGTELLHHAQIDDHPRGVLRAEAVEVAEHLHGEDHADEGAGDEDDGQRADADLVEDGPEHPPARHRPGRGEDP